MNTKKLDVTEIKSQLQSLDLWTLSDDQNWILFDYTFKDFKDAFDFMSQVAIFAEQINHHPNWYNVYNQVQVKLQTHDIGGISTKDFEMAQFIQNLITSSRLR